MEQIVVTINQGFFLFCVSFMTVATARSKLLNCLYAFFCQCVEQYNINSPQQSLSTKSNYFLRYTYPDGTTADASAQLSSANQLTSQSPGKLMIKMSEKVYLHVCNCALYVQQFMNRIVHKRMYYSCHSFYFIWLLTHNRVYLVVHRLLLYYTGGHCVASVLQHVHNLYNSMKKWLHTI